MIVKLLIRGRPISWKRGKQTAVNRKTGRSFMFVAKPHREWMKEAVKQLKAQWGDRPAIPKGAEINASIISYLGTKRLIDASNLYQGPEDALQAAGVLEDDCCIRTHNGSDRRYDKENPRVEVVIEEVTSE